MTTGIQCRADPRCEIPAPDEAGICRCHAKQASKAGAAIDRFGQPAWSGGPGCAEPGPRRSTTPSQKQADQSVELEEG
jgi:hypothetical protein